MSYFVDTGLALVAFTFLSSGIGKALTPLDAAIAAANFGVVRRVSTRVGLAIASFEIAIGVTASVGFLASSSGIAQGALLASIAALSFFTFLILRSLSRGDSFACNCFGRNSAEPISWLAVARNGLLVVVPLTAFIALAVDTDVLKATSFTTRVLAAVVVAAFLLLIRGVLQMLIAGRDPFGSDLRRWEEKLY